MSRQRRRKHHRHVVQRRFDGQDALKTDMVASDAPIKVSVMQTDSATMSVIRHDLKITLAVTAILVVALMAANYIDATTQWTFELGSLLYDLLHIR